MAAAALLIGLYSMVSIQAMSSKFFVKPYPINLSQTSKAVKQHWYYECRQTLNIMNVVEWWKIRKSETKLLFCRITLSMLKWNYYRLEEMKTTT